MVKDSKDLTVKQLTSALEQKGVEFRAYQRRSYYANLYDVHILGKEGVVLKEVTPTRGTKRKAKDDKPKKRRKTDDGERNAKKDSNEKKNEESLNSKSEDSFKKPGFAPPGKISISGPSQLRTSYADATPMPVKTKQDGKTVEKGLSRNIGKDIDSFQAHVDPSLMDQDSQRDDKEDNYNSEPPILAKEEEGDENLNATIDDENTVPANQPSIFGTLLMILVWGTVCYLLYLGYFDYSAPGKPRGLPYCNSNSTSAFRCESCPDYGTCEKGVLIDCSANFTVVDAKCMEKIPHPYSSLANLVEQQLRQRMEPQTVCKTPELYDLEEIIAIVDSKNATASNQKNETAIPNKTEILSGWIAQNRFKSLRLEGKKVGLTRHCVFCKIFNSVSAFSQEHKVGLLSAGLVLLFVIINLVQSQNEAARIMNDLAQIALAKLRAKDGEFLIADLKDVIAKDYPELYSDYAWVDVVNIVKKDDRITTGPNGGLLFSA